MRQRPTLEQEQSLARSIADVLRQRKRIPGGLLGRRRPPGLDFEPRVSAEAEASYHRAMRRLREMDRPAFRLDDTE